MRRDFTSLVYMVDGMFGGDKRASEKRMAALLAEKWQR